MRELLTAAQMRAIEQAAIESGEATGLELMERAGEGVVEAIFEQWPELEPDAPAVSGVGGSAPAPAASASPSRLGHPRDISGQKKRKAVVLCGPGNNGGDGFVVARLLHERGWDVKVFLYGDPEKLPPDARVNFERWAERGETECYALEGSLRGEKRLRLPAGFDLIVDAIFGTGLTRGFSGVFSGLAEAAYRAAVTDNGRVPIVSIDLPSGLCSDSGKILGRAIQADLTVPFHRAKTGSYLSEGAACCGVISVKDIGLEPDGAGSVDPAPRVGLIDQPADRIAKRVSAHKYSYGHALILSGPSGHTGAARLAARAGLRIGAGLVTLGVPAEAQQEVASQITAIMMRQIGEARVLEEVLKDERLNAICLGPGMGLERARELVPVAVRAEHTPYVVLDADALTAYAGDPSELFGMLHANCVLTPHAGEFARLFPDIAEKLNAPAAKGPAYSKVDATREAANRAGCVVLFKGADTVIAAPDGQCSVNSAAYERKASWLATAGSGDVLAGFITGLLARGFAPMQAAETAAWLHVECALEFGPGLIAEDLPEMLPHVFRKLEA
ncbi:MAG: NAD(P)H-hydrate dehydratase [Paracoccaceae bacterium]|jgi:hydroxyethylthiazole kinase-like uncharacterized protein yjeF|nr:NAD(P)H-hydrate dehydratase [Paracoccaceae bacterium]